jgi:hypothetical protein
MSCFGGQCFEANFHADYRNDAYDIPLERYENFATFLFRKFSQILYGLQIISKILKTISRNSRFPYSFLAAIFKLFARLMHAICRWKGKKIAHLFRSDGFPKLFTF